MLTPEQIAALPENWRHTAKWHSDHPKADAYLAGAGFLDLLTTLADGYAPPGKLLVSVADMRAFLECGITDECLVEDCPALAECDRIDPEEVSADRCRIAYRAHFGLVPEPEAANGTTTTP